MRSFISSLLIRSPSSLVRRICREIVCSSPHNVYRGDDTEQIAVKTETAHLSHTDGGDEGRVTKRLPSVHVGHVHFNRGQRYRGQRVPHAHACVGETRGVDDDRVRPIAGFVYRV